MKPVAFAGASAGGILTVVSERAYAPGEPARATVELSDGALEIEGKSIGSKRRPDGTFDVRFRLLNLRREARERLERALAAAEPPDAAR